MTSPADIADNSRLGRLVRKTFLGVLVVLIYVGPLLAFVAWPKEPGEDWYWYRDGFDRLLAGAPLYEPSWLAEPFNYLNPAEFFKWNQPPWVLPLVVPFALIPEPVARWVWFAAMAVAVLAAIVIAVPTRMRALALAIWPPTVVCVVWGNIESLIILGVALWIVGDRRKSVWLEAIGIVLASIKVVPAIPLVLLSIRHRRWQSILLAIGVGGVLLLPAVGVWGIRVVPDFITVASNIQMVLVIHNLSPAMWLDVPLIAVRVASSVAIVTAVLLRPTWLGLTTSQLAVVAWPTNPYVDWLVPGALAFLSRPPSRAPSRPDEARIMEYSADESP